MKFLPFFCVLSEIAKLFMCESIIRLRERRRNNYEKIFNPISILAITIMFSACSSADSQENRQANISNIK
jgi:hypothetical protein